MSPVPAPRAPRHEPDRPGGPRRVRGSSANPRPEEEAPAVPGDPASEAPVSLAAELGLDPTLVRLVEYDPQWLSLYQQERARLEGALGGRALAVQHVGSTAIPGMAAKPIVDIAVGASTLAVARRLIRTIRTLGYEYHPEVKIPGELFFRKPDGAYHVHLLRWNSSFWQDYLFFRDYLRTDQAAARAYLELKRELAARFSHDRAAYTQGKGRFIREILQRDRRLPG